MKADILIIYAHPDTKPRGNGWHILSEVQSALVSVGKKYVLVDLYKDGFDPVLRKEEHYVSGGKEIAPEVLAYQKLISDAEQLIVIHPIWWGGMPAILKGFFDRVLTPGFGYKYVRGIPKKLFPDKKAVVFVTSAGPWWYSRVVQEARAQRNMRKDVLGFLGVKTKVFLLPKAGGITEESKSRIRELVTHGLRFIF
ncbi:MAG: NAD(P)H-dependent oxidoreductase [Parcubacteria group bacterium]|nr:NAD(P)H-dependent oxidoreductase [Parcubacteria group bacterium]